MSILLNSAIVLVSLLIAYLLIHYTNELNLSQLIRQIDSVPRKGCFLIRPINIGCPSWWFIEDRFKQILQGEGLSLKGTDYVRYESYCTIVRIDLCRD